MFECCAGGVSPSAVTFSFDPDCGLCVYVCVRVSVRVCLSVVLVVCLLQQ